MTSAARRPDQEVAPVATTARAALYLRVSTSKQASPQGLFARQRFSGHIGNISFM